MRIPEGIVEHLETTPMFTSGGTRSTDLVPSVHFVYGMRVDPDRRWVDALVIDVKGEKLGANLADNGRFALTAGTMPNHRTYQLKGRGELLGPPDDDMRSFQKSFSDANTAAIRSMPLPDGLADVLAALPGLPATVVRLHVEDIFDQTPGPKAGSKVEG